MTDSRAAKYFWLVLAAALILRLPGIDYGLPHVYHQDEPIMVNRAMAIGASGDFNPHFFTNGSFPIYALFLSYGALFAFLKLFGIVDGKMDFAFLFFRDPSLFYLLGRLLIGCFFGVMTVFWVFKKSSEKFSGELGITASLFLAIAPIHIQNSHYIYADIPLTFAVTALFFAFLKILENPQPKNFVIAGAFFGFALSSKMTALSFLPVFLLLLGMASYRKSKKFEMFFSFKGLSIFLLAAFVALFALSPFIFLDWDNFFKQMLAQKRAEEKLEPYFHLTHSLLHGLGPFFLGLSFLGVFALIRKNKVLGFFVLAFLGVFYAANSIVGMRFARRILPIVPVFCLCAAFGWDWIRAKLKTAPAQRLLLSVILVFTVFAPAYLNLLFLKKDTRTQCLEWIEKTVAPGSVIVVDSRFFGPPLTQTRNLIDEKEKLLLGDAAGDPGDSYITNPGIDKVRLQRLEMLKKAAIGRKAYRVYALSHQKESKGLPLFLLPIVPPEKSKLTEIGVEYIIFNYQDYQSDFHSLKKDYEGRIELAAAFSPYTAHEKKFSVDRYESTAAPHRWSEIFSRKSLGPYLEVYRVRNS